MLMDSLHDADHFVNASHYYLWTFVDIGGIAEIVHSLLMRLVRHLRLR